MLWAFSAHTRIFAGFAMDDLDRDSSDAANLTRRDVLKAAVAVATGAAAQMPAPTSAQPPLASGASATAAGTAVPLTLRINGTAHSLRLDPRTTLLDALRDHVALTGTKKGCDHGQCGACTVLVDGRRINSCMTLAVMQDGHEITTIEGLAQRERLHPLQTAFLEHDAFQCGYCTPGQICSALGMLAEVRAGAPSYVSPDLRQIALNADEVRERMSGNLCRCAAYPNIVLAILDAAKQA